MKEQSQYTLSRDLHSSIVQINEHFESLDSITGIQINTLEEIKLDLLNSIGDTFTKQTAQSIPLYGFEIDKSSRPNAYSFSKVKSDEGVKIFDSENRKRIKTLIKNYRRQACEILVAANYDYRHASELSFEDPNINEYKDMADFDKQWSKRIDRKKLNVDDIFTLKRVYKLLSNSDDVWDQILQYHDSWIDEMNVLLSIENNILKARAIIFEKMRSRFCIPDYNFTRILPVVNGPNSAVKGDTIQFSVFQAALNEFQPAKINIDKGGELIKFEKGVGYIQAVVPDKKEYEVSGTIVLKLVSGTTKTIPWKYKVKVINEDI